MTGCLDGQTISTLHSAAAKAIAIRAAENHRRVVTTRIFGFMVVLSAYKANVDQRTTRGPPGTPGRRIPE
jgi:hypothetical protein